MKELALGITQDVDHKFELAMQCKKLQVSPFGSHPCPNRRITVFSMQLARRILTETAEDEGSESKWQQLGDAALQQGEHFDLALAEEAFTRAKDASSLLLIYSSTGNQMVIALSVH